MKYHVLMVQLVRAHGSLEGIRRELLDQLRTLNLEHKAPMALPDLIKAQEAIDYLYRHICEMASDPGCYD